MAVVPEGGPEGITPTEVTTQTHTLSEKGMDEKHFNDIEVASDQGNPDSDYDDAAKIYVPDDSDEVIDPRLKDYPIPLVAKTVDLHNDFT